MHKVNVILLLYVIRVYCFAIVLYTILILLLFLYRYCTDTATDINAIIDTIVVTNITIVTVIVMEIVGVHFINQLDVNL